MRWLIVARGLSGIGGGGIVNSVWVLTTEIVPPGSQAKWSQALSVTWSASAVAGPILGGLFTGACSLSLNDSWHSQGALLLHPPPHSLTHSMENGGNFTDDNLLFRLCILALGL
jgi:MFS family permease